MERTGDLGDHRGVVSFPPFFCCVHHFRAKGAFWQKGGKSQDHEFRKRRRRRRVELRKKSFPFVFIPRRAANLGGGVAKIEGGKTPFFAVCIRENERKVEYRHNIAAAGGVELLQIEIRNLPPM